MGALRSFKRSQTEDKDNRAANKIMVARANRNKRELEQTKEFKELPKQERKSVVRKLFQRKVG